jgi:hypothetical protein
MISPDGMFWVRSEFFQFLRQFGEWRQGTSWEASFTPLKFLTFAPRGRKNRAKLGPRGFFLLKGVI